VQLKPNFSDQDRRFSRAFERLRQGIAARAFPGCSLCVVHRGQLVASKGLGRFTYEPQSPEVGAGTVWDIASLTKVVATTVMAMILYERGLLDLEAPLEWILRPFRGDDPRREEVTVRTLLAHTSGLPAYVRLFEQAQSREALLAAAYRTPLEAAPGERTEYSDIGFILLGELLARLADESLDSFCAREIFGPLGMADTCFNPPNEWRSRIPPTEDDMRFRRRVIQGEVNDENAFVMGGVAGHAGLFAAADDVAALAQAVVRPGHGICRPETLQVFAKKEVAKDGSGRALGFDIPSSPSQSGQYFSPHAIGHLGFTGGSLWIDGERELAVVLLTNRTWPDRKSQAIKRVRPLVHDAIVEGVS
jgi:CubicO group peptidase (beta-lactamase class C family)